MASDVDEFELIARYFAPLAAGEPGAFGLTDDAAELAVAPGRRLVITTDAIVSGVHFPVSEDPQTIASRLVRVNLSDLAAKGAAPRAYTVVLGLPDTATPEWISAFAKGLAEEQDRFGISLIGGDTTRTGGPLMLSVTMMGEVAENTMILRSGATVGDNIYVSGTIGDAMLGLALMEGRINHPDKAQRTYLLERFRMPEPRVKAGLGLVGLASAAADVSDGLVADLNHICDASGVNADIELEKVPISAAARELVTADQGLRVSLLTGGDDYELVFTAPNSASQKLQELAAACGVGLSKIGQIIDGGAGSNAVMVRDAAGQRVEVSDAGYQHFHGRGRRR